MEEFEDPTEKLNDKINEEAGEANQRAKDRWIMGVALFTAIVSVFAAFSGMLSAHHENESLIAQMKASDQWNYYQAKGIKKEIVASYGKMQNDTAAISRVKQYNTDQEQIKSKAEDYEKDMEEHLARHLKISRAVTLFQITIAISAISILTRRKIFWFLGMLFAAGGCVFLITGVV